MENFPGTFSFCLEATMTDDEPNHCFVRLVGTIDVTFNQLAVMEVDGSQLCQGLEAFEVSCVEQECISVYMENFSGTFSCCLEATAL